MVKAPVGPGGSESELLHRSVGLVLGMRGVPLSRTLAGVSGPACRCQAAPRLLLRPGSPCLQPSPVLPRPSAAVLHVHPTPLPWAVRGTIQAVLGVVGGNLVVDPPCKDGILPPLILGIGKHLVVC